MKYRWISGGEIYKAGKFTKIPPTVSFCANEPSKIPRSPQAKGEEGVETIPRGEGHRSTSTGIAVRPFSTLEYRINPDRKETSKLSFERGGERGGGGIFFIEKVDEKLNRLDSSLSPPLLPLPLKFRFHDRLDGINLAICPFLYYTN